MHDGVATGPTAASRRGSLVLEGVGVRYGATVALADVDLELRRGEVLGLVGENGAGKSTLIGVASGAVRPDAGGMTLFDEPYAPISPLEARRRGIATIHQELSLVPHLTVAENVRLGSLPTRGPFVDVARANEIAREALRRVGAERVDPRTRVLELAPAERQLVEIARAVAEERSFVVLDEPTSSLGRADAEHLFDLVEDLRAHGVGILYVSHALEEVDRLCDRVVVLRDGRRVASFARGEYDDGLLVHAMAGRELESFERKGRAPGELLLEVARRDGRGATLRVRRGEIVGIAGLVGSGRTEMLRECFGLEERLVYDFSGPFGDERVARSPWRRGVGLVSEDRAGEGLALSRSIAENLCLPRLDRVARAGVWLSPSELGRAADAWCGRVGVRGAGVDSAVRSLSGGNQQKVALARLLHADVELLLLDEPTRGVDVGAKAAIYRIVSALAQGEGRDLPCGVLVVSSYLPELLALCDCVAVARNGVLGAARPVEEWDEHALLAAATARDGGFA
ncbi:MAG: sugar ABC transporter ATP-binding protein [Planctomycetota bacterium]